MAARAYQKRLIGSNDANVDDPRMGRDQETPESCVPACLRMVFGSFGVNTSEAELREQCDCTHYGTDALKAVDAARQFGLAGTAKHTLTLEELRTIVAEGEHPNWVVLSFARR